jgi:glycosyltransferase involved in cell wall biosynthesis
MHAGAADARVPVPEPDPDAGGPTAPELSVVILGYRAQESLAGFVSQVVAGLEELDARWEVVLVANFWPGIEDSTPTVAQRLAAAEPRLRVVAEAKRGGMGWDMRSGFAAARGRYVAVIDGDGQMPAGDLLRVFAEVRGAGADLGKTFRASRDDGALRRLLSAGYNAVFRLLFPGLAVRDVNSKPKIVRAEALAAMALASEDWFIDAEMMIAARRLGLKVVEVPTSFGRLAGRQSFVRLSAVLEFLRNLARHRVREWRR